MSSFADYIATARFEVYSDLLDNIKRDKQYQVYQGINPLLTPGGNMMIHDSERFIQYVITDLIFRPATEDKRLSAPVLFAYQKDVVEQGNVTFKAGWDDLLSSDPFVILKATGKNSFQPFRPKDKLFSFAFMSLSSLVKLINDFVNTSMSELDIQDADSNPFPELLKWRFEQLPAEQKVLVQALSGIHNSGIVLPLVLILGVITPDEYVKGLISIKIMAEPAYESTMLDVTCAMDYLMYCWSHSENIQQIGTIIRDGENESVEFKSTLRWDLRGGKTNQAVERACMKTISAFLNSAGGTLLIGVRDDGSIEGIESDKFVNDDKFLLHLWTLIRTCLGRDVSRYIRSQLEKFDEKTVCVVNCLQSNRPVFLRQPGFNEEFYIRVGPSSNAMDISEALKYIADHFDNG